MKNNRYIYLITFSLLIFFSACRDVDNEKDLDDELDGTREVNVQELGPMDNRPSSDTLDQKLPDGAGEGVYRANDIPEHDEGYEEN